MTPDDERQQWILDPYAAVGPLRFGMTPDAVSAALGGAKTDERWCTTWGNTVIGTERHRDVGVTLHYAEGTRLACVMADALDGPQVAAEGVELVGRVPSELEASLTERAEEREPFTELFLMPLEQGRATQFRTGVGRVCPRPRPRRDRKRAPLATRPGAPPPREGAGRTGAVSTRTGARARIWL